MREYTVAIENINTNVRHTTTIRAYSSTEAFCLAWERYVKGAAYEEGWRVAYTI